jgi:gamma-glutamyl-gamma-aminobutyraldehyde dehydrogenase
MSKLLSRTEYQRIADELCLPSDAFIGGEFVHARSGETMETHNPATGRLLNRIASCDTADVDRAVGEAQRTFDSGVWARMHPADRKRTLKKWVELIGAHQEELAVMESLDSGKPIRDCVTIDLPETMHCLTWYAEAADKLYGSVSPSGDQAMGVIYREPMGVVACVLPWNFPLMMLSWKAGPALAAGNSLIVKPAEQTSMTALRMAELAIEAGLPPGVLNVVPGLGEKAGQAIGLHPGIQAVSFTGSTEVGRLFLEYSARSNLKKVVLECGGKSPAVVLADAENLDGVAQHVAYAVLWSMGENCTANARLIVHRSVKEDLLGRILAQMKQWKTGDPLEPENSLGAIISREQFDKIMGYIEAGKGAGARLIMGGNSLEIGSGLFVAPTVFDDVTPDMIIAREEIFGPVLSVLTADSDEQAIEWANDTAYGLQASLFAGNVKKAVRTARQLQAGTVTVNCYGEGDITTPFGGFKLSGFGGRDNSLQAFDQYMETKTIWFDLSQP